MPDYDDPDVLYDDPIYLYDGGRYQLTPPTTDESFRQYENTDPLWRWYRVQVGLSAVKVDGTWQVAKLGSYPGEDGLEAAYQGGRVYLIESATALEMIADGLGEYLEIV